MFSSFSSFSLVGWDCAKLLFVCLLHWIATTKSEFAHSYSYSFGCSVLHNHFASYWLILLICALICVQLREMCCILIVIIPFLTTTTTTIIEYTLVCITQNQNRSKSWTTKTPKPKFETRVYSIGSILTVI